MLVGLSRQARLRVTIVIVMLYALGLLVPNPALALGVARANCLLHLHSRPAVDNVHAKAAQIHDASQKVIHHTHESDTQNNDDCDDCYCIYCISSLAADGSPILIGPPGNPKRAAAPGDIVLSGLDPSRLNRPPIA